MLPVIFLLFGFCILFLKRKYFVCYRHKEYELKMRGVCDYPGYWSHLHSISFIAGNCQTKSFRKRKMMVNMATLQSQRHSVSVANGHHYRPAQLSP